MRGRRPIACLIAAAALLGLSACASSDDEPEDGPKVTLQRAARATRGAVSAHIRESITLVDGHVDATGYVDLVNGDMTMALDAPGEATVRTVLVDLVQYMQKPPRQRRWLKIDLRRGGWDVGVHPATAIGGPTADPHYWIGQLGWAEGVETVGHATVDGAETTCVKATLD